MYKYSIKYNKDRKYITLATIRKRLNNLCSVIPQGTRKRPCTYEEFKESIPEDIRNMFSEQVIIDAYYHSKSLLQTTINQDKVLSVYDFAVLDEDTHYRIRHFRPRIMGLPSKSLTTQQMYILESLNMDVHGMRYTHQGFNLKGTVHVND